MKNVSFFVQTCSYNRIDFYTETHILLQLVFKGFPAWYIRRKKGGSPADPGSLAEKQIKKTISGCKVKKVSGKIA